MTIPTIGEDPWGAELIDHLRLLAAPQVSGQQLRVPVAHTGSGATLTLTSTYQNDLYLTKYVGRGQTFSSAVVGAVGTVMSGGTNVRIVAVAYEDDGTGAAPALNTDALASSSDISGFTSNGEKSAAITFTEPDGVYWAGFVFRYDVAPSTYPSFTRYDIAPFQQAPVSLVTNAGVAKGYLADSAAAASIPQLTALTVDNTNRVTVGFRV